MQENKYINREISWLQFNARVLQEAEDESVPLIERLRFLGIFSNNLDEFFKVRYATVKRIDLAGKTGKNVLGGIKANKLLEQITDIVRTQQTESLKILDRIQKKLRDEHDICVINEKEINSYQQKFVKDYFLSQVSPALVTIVLNDLEELPMLKDSAAYLAVKMEMSPNSGKTTNSGSVSNDIEKKYVLIEIPKSVDRFVMLPSEDEKTYIIILDDLIRYNLKSIFNIFEYDSISAHMIKITRDAELDIDNDLSKSFIEKISESVKDRIKGDPVRFVYDKNIDNETLTYLMDKMGIDHADSIIPGGRYHNRRDYMNFPRLDAKELLYESKEPLPINGLALQTSLIQGVGEKDHLLYAPYQSFSYVVKFLREAALDPRVKSIKITIYRLAKISHIASSLINAVKNGKKVLVQIELRARFDEAANIKYAEQMQREGVHLIFGVKGLKVHCKCCVIEREEPNGELKKYGFVSTGNFNESTSKAYTDYTLFTANQEILKEVNKVFNFFETNYKVSKYRHLLVSPHYTRNSLYKLIQKEIDNQLEGKPAGIKLKLNSLSDYPMIDKLYQASRAGVKIKLIVRGLNCLIPGVPGMSENIEAISIVDKFLEHPRVYIFENDGNSRVYISSADIMTRNLNNRVEIACPIYDADIKQEVIDGFNISWGDNVKARVFSEKQNNAHRKNGLPRLRSQEALYDYYLNKLEN
ncbi:polyphosphate kinase 1 [Zunongwangia sp.]|uniref:polyphosphate kinase 1 n=1 Tax=Zunongwangia sp. TaxID=1965325 RepID=UPI003AA95A66